MQARSFSRLAPQVIVTLFGAALALSLPACDCAGNTGMTGDDAGDTGPLSDGGPPRDGGPDTGAHDGGADANVQIDAGMCSNPETCNGVDDDCNGTTDENTDVSCGTNIGICRVGTQVCTGGALAACAGGVMPAASDTCGNGQDDDCDETVDEGCVCTDGATQSCGSGVGECRRGTQTCAANAWGACVGEVAPTAELCDGLDNNCDGIVDEGCACTTGATQACGVMIGACMMGTQTCVAGAWGACTGGVGPAAETCNGVDDNCDGTSDEGFMLGTACDGPDADACNEGAFVCDPTTGGAMCSDATNDNVETCNGMDDDCDGNTDEGNPGATSAMIGTCISQTNCVGGSLVSTGTFVAVSGGATGGSASAPVNSIATAIANAVAIGGGVDVCVCDTAAAGAATYTENVTMVEGVDVLGGLDCTTWAPTAGRTTIVQDVDADGLTFPAGITAGTALDHMSVIGFDSAASGSMTAAVTITDASPTLSVDTVSAGRAPNAIGLRVVHAAAAASPTITGGTYTAIGVATGRATAVSLEGSSPAFQMVTIGGASSAGAVAASAYGVHCTDCGGTTFSGGSVSTSGATTTGYGFYGTGNLAGLTASSTNFGGGQTTGTGSTSYGVRLETCMGAPTFTTVNSNGGFPAGTGTIRTAFASSGMSCAPVIDGGRYMGCEAGNNCYGIDASGRSQIVVRNVNPGPGGAPIGIIGSTAAATDVAIGVRCQTGACASITNSTIAAGTLGRAPTIGAGMWIEGASPRVDSNRITGPNGQSPIAPPMIQMYGLLLRTTSSVVTNNVVHDGTESLRVFDVLYDMTPGVAAVGEPTVVNNTIDYTPCAGCGQRVGLVFFSNAVAMPSGIFRNNFVHNLGAGGSTSAVIEANVNADPRVFENNALWDPTAAAVYLDPDQAVPALSTAIQINALNGMPATASYSGNLVVDCLLNATFHLPMTSMCVDVGTNTSCPAADFEAQARPFNATCDIGADEFRP